MTTSITMTGCSCIPGTGLHPRITAVIWGLKVRQQLLNIIGTSFGNIDLYLRSSTILGLSRGGGAHDSVIPREGKWAKEKDVTEMEASCHVCPVSGDERPASEVDSTE